MGEINTKNMAFFLETGGSLSKWAELGILDRETGLYNLMAEKFNKIYIITYGDKSEFKYANNLRKNIHVLHRKKCTRNPFLNSLYEAYIPFIFYKYLKNCDILKSNQNLGSLAPTISKILNPKSKLIIRSGYIGSLNAKLARFPFHIKAYLLLTEVLSYFFCDKAFITTKENQEILLRKYKFLKNKLLVIENFIDTERFKKNPTIKKYDIIYVARFHRDKNHLFLLEALKECDLKILFIGKGEEVEKVKQYAKTINPQVSIISVVANESLPVYYNQSRICVFPSLHEGNPKALLEAMSCELPVVGFNVFGINNIIVSGFSGLLSEIDKAKIKENILRLLGDNAYIENLGKNARKSIEENFSLEKVLKKELQIYKEL